MGISVAVAGAGIVGASVAWRLTQSGCRVTLFDARQIGSESSWAGAGMLAPGGEFEQKSFWSDFAIESLRIYPAFVDELARSSGVPIDFRACGAFEVAFDEREALAIEARGAGRAAIGIYSEQFNPSRVPGVVKAVAAQYYPDDAVVNPRDVMRALELACRQEGVEIRERTPFHGGMASAFDAVVIAAGAWSSSLASPGAAFPESYPVRGHLIAFDDHARLAHAIIRHGETYLLRRSPHQVIAGASTEDVGFDRTLDGTVTADLAERAARLLPALEGRPYSAWLGFRPATRSGEPALGRVPSTTMWLAYGHYRNGILMAPASAQRIAAEITQASSQTDSLLQGAHLI